VLEGRPIIPAELSEDKGSSLFGRMLGRRSS
jgi:hypothetical protein